MNNGIQQHVHQADRSCVPPDAAQTNPKFLPESPLTAARWPSSPRPFGNRGGNIGPFIVNVNASILNLLSAAVDSTFIYDRGHFSLQQLVCSTPAPELSIRNRLFMQRSSPTLTPHRAAVCRKRAAQPIIITTALTRLRCFEGDGP